MPATDNPKRRGKIAALGGMRKSVARRAPVQTPVPGRGKATKKNRAHGPNRAKCFRCLSCQAKYFATSEPKGPGNLRKRRSMRGRKAKRKGMGRRFPRKAQRKASLGGSPKDKAKGIPPRSSLKGAAETAKTQRISFTPEFYLVKRALLGTIAWTYAPL